MANGEYFFKKEKQTKQAKKNLESSTEQSLCKLQMVPRPRKKLRKMTMGRSDNPQNAMITPRTQSQGSINLVLEQGAPL